MKNFKILFNTIAQEGGPQEGGPSGNLTWGCYPHANTCIPRCPGNDPRWTYFQVDENGCAGDGFIEVPLQFTGTGSFEMHWSLSQLSETEGIWTYEDGDFEPESGVVNVTNGINNLIRIDVRDNFGGPAGCVDWQDPQNCPENSPNGEPEIAILTLDLEYLPPGVTWDPHNIATPGSAYWNSLGLHVINVDPHTDPTVDLNTYCEQNPGAPGCPRPPLPDKGPGATSQ